MQKEYPKQSQLVCTPNDSITFSLRVSSEDDLAVSKWVDWDISVRSPTHGVWHYVPASRDLVTRRVPFKGAKEVEVGFTVTEWGEDRKAPTGRDISLEEVRDPLDWSEVFTWTVQVVPEKELQDISWEELFTYTTGAITLTREAYNLYKKPTSTSPRGTSTKSNASMNSRNRAVTVFQQNFPTGRYALCIQQHLSHLLDLCQYRCDQYRGWISRRARAKRRSSNAGGDTRTASILARPQGVRSHRG